MTKAKASSTDAADRPIRLTRLGMLRRLLFRQLPPDEAREVREAVDRDGALTERYILMCALSAGIATLGLLQSSTAVVIGAMLVSPLMSPIASLGFAFASFDGRRAENAAKVLGIGVATGVGIGMLLTWLSPIRNPTPEIIARTAPTLLDLAVAILSGVAGGYATVHRKGETAIGVAIATALMPPLATLGYSIGTGRFAFAGGALLLFLTNLGAISFSFALVARIRGVARPLSRVEFKPIHIAAMIGAFLLLATPLALTLHRVAREAVAARAANAAITSVLDLQPTQIAQMTVRWSLTSGPEIAATTIVPQFRADADEKIRERLNARLHADAKVVIQQIVAADPTAETKAMIDAALAQIPPAIQSAVPQVAPPTSSEINTLRNLGRLAIVNIWADTADTLHVLAAPQPDWTLADYFAEEQRMNQVGLVRKVEIIPPMQTRIQVLLEDIGDTLTAEQAQTVSTVRWALTRWGVSACVVEGYTNGNRTDAAQESALKNAELVSQALETDRIKPLPAAGAPEPAPARTRSSRQPTDRPTSVEILPFERS